MLLRIDPGGQVVCVYGEAIDLEVLGPLSIQRASHVEPDQTGQWWVDLSLIGGPRQGPFAKRSEALAAEMTWLDQHLFPGQAKP